MKKGGYRLYLDHSINQLEDMFDLNRGDSRILQALRSELTFRTTDRAKKLRAKVMEALTAMPVDQTVTTPPRPGGSPKDPPNVGGQAPPNRPRPVAPANPQPVPLPNRPPPPTPRNPNEPSAILAAWTALEALSPQTYRRPEDMAAGDRRCVADLSSGQMPWGKGERSRPKMQLYYQVILGAIPMDEATRRLVAVFGEDEERDFRIRDKAAIAAVLVDRNGLVVEQNGVAVSSFAWALPAGLRGELSGLGAWSSVEPKIVEQLDAMLRRHDKEGKQIALDLATIDKAHRWLVEHLGLPGDLVERPSFALRVYHYYKAKAAPEAALLNSFFLTDLAQGAGLIGKGQAPAGLRRYLGADRPETTVDLLADKTAIERAVAPSLTPAARWPSPGGHPLVLLQQAAVNLARSELAGKEGLVTVNGPPGTGKTTLLRDIVAACVLDRALAMAAFDDPEKAFTASGEKVAAGDKAFFQLHALAPSLKGHEILVASSNNRAVENVSRELPAVRAVGRPLDELSYFKSISDFIHGPRDDAEPGDDRPRDTGTAESWGMIAAVLGNRRNLSAFVQTFWWDDDRSFRLYLKAARGDAVVREITDPATGRIERRTPSVVALEKPPSPEAARANWRKARERLLALKATIDAELKALEDVRRLCLNLAEARRTQAEIEMSLERLSGRRAAAETDKRNHENRVQTAGQEHAQCRATVAQSRKTRPGLVARLFRTEHSKAWTRAHAPLVEAADGARRSFNEAEAQLAETSATIETLATEAVTAEHRLSGTRQDVERLAAQVDCHRKTLGERIVDEAFFARGHEPSHRATPWIPDSLQRKREDLFIAALSVHRAFIDASARKVYHNLGALVDVMSNGPPKDDAKRKMLGDLWSTLFMTVPVMSTTFASTERLLGKLPAGSIGWLLIDEAGQTLPQAAVGAIMRARRTVAVGDPLQIPPIVTMPDRLTAEICKTFKVEPSRWAAPEASSQTLADRASRFQAAFRSAEGPRRVGIPLLVHRRCQEPMFGIFNRIAYDGQMVHASGPATSGGIGAALGPSRWFDVDGAAESKWCPAEGDLVISLLKKVAEAGITKPDLFVVTPFRIVAQEMRRRLEQERALFAALGVDAREWGNDRVGTIHTVQGREADSVIFVLGAPKASQTGARHWATAMPNIFNVAISRARQNLYIIGSHGAWSGLPNARDLASIPRIRVQPDRTEAMETTSGAQILQNENPGRPDDRIRHRQGPTV